MSWDEIMTQIEVLEEAGYYFTIRNGTCKITGHITVTFIGEETKTAVELALKRIKKDLDEKN